MAKEYSFGPFWILVRCGRRIKFADNIFEFKKEIVKEISDLQGITIERIMVYCNYDSISTITCNVQQICDYVI